MTQLNQKTRDQLPDRAFAYIDSKGRRRLPINDEAHVRNALSRFNQTAFEDEAAQDRARTRLLKAAKKCSIVPVGFMTGQLRSKGSSLAIENERLLGEIDARVGDISTLPTGLITFLLADMEDSTGLVRELGDRYAALASPPTGVRSLLRARPGRRSKRLNRRASPSGTSVCEQKDLLELAQRFRYPFEPS